MIKITNAEASANILAHVAEGRITQQQWHGKDARGREIACLLGAIHPGVTSPEECNAKLMPLWLAEVVPTLFDGLPAESVVPIAKRFGELIGRWYVLTPEQWDEILMRFLVRTIDDAVTAARPVCEDKDYWSAVESACDQCRTAIQSSNKAAAEVACEVAWAAVWAATEAAAWATTEAARAAAGAARAARAAEAAAYSSLFTFLLVQIEDELK